MVTVPGTYTLIRVTPIRREHWKKYIIPGNPIEQIPDPQWPEKKTLVLGSGRPVEGEAPKFYELRDGESTEIYCHSMLLDHLEKDELIEIEYLAEPVEEKGAQPTSAPAASKRDRSVTASRSKSEPPAASPKAVTPASTKKAK